MTKSAKPLSLADRLAHQVPGAGEGPVALSPSDRRLTRAQQLTADLEDEIVSGRLPPGTKLEEQSLADRYALSRTPVREALQELVALSLAQRQPYKGVVVAEITQERLDQLFEAMAEVEAMCGRISAQRMTPTERAQLADLHREMEGFVSRGEVAAYEEANRAFHEAIYEGTHNTALLEIAHATRRRLAPFRRSQLKQGQRMAHSFEEHAAIVKAVLERDATATERLMRRHLTSAATASLALLEGARTR